MKKKILSQTGLIALMSVAVTASLSAQDTKAKTDTIKSTETKVGKTSNVMLNASADNGPRTVNIG